MHEEWRIRPAQLDDGITFVRALLGIRQWVPTFMAGSSLRWIILNTVWVDKFSSLAAWPGVRNSVRASRFSIESLHGTVSQNNLSTFVDKIKWRTRSTRSANSQPNIVSVNSSIKFLLVGTNRAPD